MEPSMVAKRLTLILPLFPNLHGKSNLCVDRVLKVTECGSVSPDGPLAFTIVVKAGSSAAGHRQVEYWTPQGVRAYQLPILKEDVLHD